MANKVSALATAKAPTEPKVLRGVIDDGTREIPLVNKFGKLICKVYIRPADWSIIDRYNDLTKDFDAIVKPLTDLDLKNDGTASVEKDWGTLKAVETELKHRFDQLFDMEEADEIFAKRNAFSSIGGEFFCSKVLMALGGIIEEAVQEEAALSQARVAKYLTQPEILEGVKDAGATADDA